LSFAAIFLRNPLQSIAQNAGLEEPSPKVPCSFAETFTALSIQPGEPLTIVGTEKATFAGGL
jgi:hypothetical protein